MSISEEQDERTCLEEGKQEPEWCEPHWHIQDISHKGANLS